VADVAAIPPGEGPVVDDLGVHDHLDPPSKRGMLAHCSNVSGPI